MSVDFLYFSWEIDPEGRPLVRHECLNGVEQWTPPNPPWTITANGAITPSFHCTDCGRHLILSRADRTDLGGAA